MNDDSPCTCGVPLMGHCLNLAVVWAPTELQETSPGSLTWVATMPAPTGGQWTAFFIDLQFDGEAACKSSPIPRSETPGGGGPGLPLRRGRGVRVHQRDLHRPRHLPRRGLHRGGVPGQSSLVYYTSLPPVHSAFFQ